MRRTSLPSDLRVVRGDDGSSQADSRTTQLELRLQRPTASTPILRAAVRELAATLHDSEVGRLERLDAMVAAWRVDAQGDKQKKRVKSAWPAEDRQRLLASLCILVDLVRQGWAVRLGPRGARVEIERPPESSGDPLVEKDRIRKQEHIKRDEQLAKGSTREFIRSMEKKRLHRGAFTSVISLMRDGRELAASVRAANALPEPDRAAAMARLIQPYLQFVDEGARCDLTGLRLMDIWRYFRHTWANQYVSVPGRSMQFLVRDAAAPFHPVIGICAISSPIVQIRERDLWIGWHPDRFLSEVRSAPTDKVARWLVDIVERGLAGTYHRDFIEDGTLDLAQYKAPRPDTIQRLLEVAKKERELHHRFASAKEQKKEVAAGDAGWLEKAKTHLFRSKRAIALADLLEARSVLTAFFGGRPTKTKLGELLDDSRGAQVVARILRKAKGDRVGIVMADISVCGAIPPYNSLLGGKLVAMLATSPEVVQQYRKRYGEAVSEIASATAGRAVVRRPDLVFLSTTSLYGGSSQYNRIAIPGDRLGGARGTLVKYHETGRSEAYGTSHFSEETVEALVTLMSQRENGIRVNSIFGEGQSPKMRKIREGLEELGFPADPLLRHGRRRVVYCIPLISNVRDFMVGLDTKPLYLVPQDAPKKTSDLIVQWWRERWLYPRAAKPEIVDAVGKHSLVYPIRHGAKVVLPPDAPGDQLEITLGN